MGAMGAQYKAQPHQAVRVISSTSQLELPRKSGCIAALQATYGLALMAGSACTFSVVTLLVSLLATRFPIYQIVRGILIVLCCQSLRARPWAAPGHSLRRLHTPMGCHPLLRLVVVLVGRAVVCPRCLSASSLSGCAPPLPCWCTVRSPCSSARSGKPCWPAASSASSAWCSFVRWVLPPCLRHVGRVRRAWADVCACCRWRANAAWNLCGVDTDTHRRCAQAFGNGAWRCTSAVELVHASRRSLTCCLHAVLLRPTRASFDSRLLPWSSSWRA